MESHPRILVIDDEPSILEIVSAILEDEGYTVETATNGQEGLEILSGARPELVLLDMRMPVMDGWRFARAMHKQGIKVPILVVTATQHAERWAAEIAADSYVGKPFEVNQLLASIEAILQQE